MNMKRNTKRIWSFGIFGAFVFIFSLQFVSAVAGDSILSQHPEGLFVSLWKAFFGGMGGIGSGNFTTFLQNKLGIMGAQGASAATIFSLFILMFLVAMMVYDIADILPFFNSGWAKSALSISFAFLAFMSFDINQIRYLLSTYQAVGITMIAIIPFVVIYAFVWKLDKKAENDAKPSYQMFGSAIWTFLGVYLFFKWNSLRATSNSSNIIMMAYFSLALVALIMVFLHSKIFALMAKKINNKKRELGMKKGNEAVKDGIRRQIARIDEDILLAENVADLEKVKSLREKRETLQASLEELSS